MCFTETWLRPGELAGIKLGLQNHSLLRKDEYEVFSKSARNDVTHLSRTPFEGISIIVKENKSFTFGEITCSSERVISVGMYDNQNDLVQVLS